MVNVTEMVKAFKGKRLNNFLRTNQTKDFVKVLESPYSKKRNGNKFSTGSSSGFAKIKIARNIQIPLLFGRHGEDAGRLYTRRRLSLNTFSKYLWNSHKY